jgi:hypothetical protein
VGETDVLEVLALELSNDLLEAVGVSVNADGGEDLLDVGGRGGLIASEGEEEVSCEVLHFDLTISKKKIVVSVDVKTLDAKEVVVCAGGYFEAQRRKGFKETYLWWPG